MLNKRLYAGIPIWGATPQTPLSVFDMGYAHVRERPLKTSKLYGCLGGYIICGNAYMGGDPQTPLILLENFY
jgi:hypothetical protein